MINQNNKMPVCLSFVVPVYNEEVTIKPLAKKIHKVMNQEGIANYEIIFVDDGSRDGSWIQIRDLVNQFPTQIKAIKFRRNFGKAAALSAGFQNSTGKIIFTLDADLQDDPAEVPQFLQKLDEGFDLVSGWRHQRNDPLSKKLPSKLFNQVTSKVAGIHLHDFNCGFKVYRKEVLDSLKLYGELHRYIPVLAHGLGFRVGEVAVHHFPRQHGSSKYGWERYTRGLIDLLTVFVVTRFLYKPGHLFGNMGLIFGFLGVGSLTYLTILWFIGLGPIGTRPLLFFGILSTILSVQLISLGILAELNTRHVDSDYIDKQISEIIGGKYSEQGLDKITFSSSVSIQ
jgi:glycosyltransferase involved in cell wall biosynthesis